MKFRKLIMTAAALGMFAGSINLAQGAGEQPTPTPKPTPGEDWKPPVPPPPPPKPEWPDCCNGPTCPVEKRCP